MPTWKTTKPTTALIICIYIVIILGNSAETFSESHKERHYLSFCRCCYRRRSSLHCATRLGSAVCVCVFVFHFVFLQSEPFIIQLKICSILHSICLICPEQYNAFFFSRSDQFPIFFSLFFFCCSSVLSLAQQSKKNNFNDFVII